MSEVIERIACAIASDLKAQADASRGLIFVNPRAMEVLDGVTLDGVFDLLTVARAAIEAIRKPTDAMIQRGWQDGAGGWGEGEEIPDIWRAMIDAALGD